jgi:hypothetical protein
MAANWNISLFYYRDQGADYRSNNAEFDRFLGALG